MSIRKVLFAICLFIVSFAGAQCNYTTPVTYSYNCIPQYPSIARVKLNNLDNSTSCSGSYADYSGNVALQPTLYRGTLDTVLVQANYSEFSNTDQYMAVFIDWNNNNEYDAGEYIHMGYVYGYENSFNRQYFTVPTDAVLGSVRMRVRSCSWSESLTNQDLCTTYNYGETEDYMVTIADTAMSISYTSMQPVLSYPTVTQGTANVPVLRIDVNGEGTLTPKQLDKLYFHLPNSVQKENFSAAKLYYTATADTFNTNTLVTSVSSFNSSFAFTGLNRTVNGGKSYYWLAFDIASNASIDDSIDAISDSAVFSGENYIPYQNDPYGILNIDYCVPAYTGNCNYYIQSVQLPGIDYTSGCAGGYYKDSYSGYVEESGTYFCFVRVNDTSDVAILLDYNDDGDFLDEKEFTKIHALPGKDYGVELNVPDSVATFFRARVFSASSISSPAESCNAESVYDFNMYGDESEPMELYGAVAGNVTRKLAQKGESSVAVMVIGVEAFGTDSPLTVNALKFSTKGTSDISVIGNAKLWYTKGYAEFDKDSAVLLSTLPTITENFQLTSTQTLYPGMNYFWLTYDVKSSGSDGDKIDATCDTIMVGNDVYEVNNNSPSGYVLLSDTLWMRSATITQCRTILYDDGGPDGNYSDNSYTLTLATTPGRYFEVHFRKFETEGTDDDIDRLTFFEGGSPNPNSIIAEYSKFDPPSSVLNTADNVLTIQFDKGSLSNAKGWEIEILCKYNCGNNPISLNYTLEDGLCWGGLQKLTTAISSNYTKPLTYTFEAYGEALNYDSVKVVNGVSDDTTFYLYSQYLNSQYYYLTVLDSNECSAGQYVYPNNEPASPFDINVTINESCPNDSSGSIALNPTTIGTTTYKWSGMSTATTKNLPQAPPGFYSVHVVDANGCKDTSFVLEAFPEEIPTPRGITGPTELGANPGTRRYSLPSLPIDDNENEGDGTQGWRTTPLGGTQDYIYDLALSPSNAGEITVDSLGALIAWSESFGGEAKLYVRYQHIETGCYSFYSLPYIVSIESVPVEIIAEEAEAAEGFSPNGDGKNDFFVIRNLTSEGNTIFVYNREGVIIYQKENYKNDWDGTLNGDGKSAVADGVYFWVLENADGIPTFKGFIELRR